MQFSRVPFFGVVVAAVLISASARAQQMSLLDVGDRSQLLADPNLVFDSEGVAFTPHPARKHPDNPLVRADQPWEGWYVTAFASTVLFDEEEQRFKMWYACAGGSDYFPKGGICYAESADGLQWTKPPVGTREAAGGRPHNSVSPWLCPSVFKDQADPDASRRYKMVCFDQDRGYLTQFSPDGLAWREGQVPFLPISYVDDVISAFRDRDGRFVALPKMSTPVYGRMRRTIYSSFSHDFEHWSKVEPAYMADRRDDLGSLARIERARPLLNYPDNRNVIRTEFYGAGAYAAESCVIGFPWVFTISANVPQRSNQEGPIEVQLAVTRDRETWARPFRTPIIPIGKAGEWDAGMILSASQAIDVGDEVWLYYGGANYTHGAAILYGGKESDRGTKYSTAIGLATWPKDRFVSADAGAAGGALTTAVFRFSGKRLEINAATKEAGEVRVELLDPAGRPIPGFAPSEPIRGDSLRAPARFKDADLATLIGKPVCLRFHLRDAQLYAFAFRDPQ